jgi:hypothetical protein
MPISKQQWADIEKALSGTYGMVTLVCDGYDLKLSLELVDKRSLAIVTYVNGVWKGEWFRGEADEAKRFLCPVSRYIHKPKQRAALIKIYGGKRCPKAELERINKKFTTYQPFWTSVTALRRHLVKHNQSVELVKIGFGD